MEELQKALKVAFASEFTYYLKAHNFHWNVEGMFFKQLHDLFGSIYEEVYDNIDTFAENIRKTGAYTPGSLEKFTMLSRVDDENGVPDAKSMCAELLSDSEKMISMFKITFKYAERINEQGLCDFIANRIDAHQKHAWMLRSTLKTSV
jgi:starvation-inducible DNA-binding protein